MPSFCSSLYAEILKKKHLYRFVINKFKTRYNLFCVYLLLKITEHTKLSQFKSNIIRTVHKIVHRFYLKGSNNVWLNVRYHLVMIPLWVYVYPFPVIFNSWFNSKWFLQSRLPSLAPTHIVKGSCKSIYDLRST